MPKVNGKSTIPPQIALAPGLSVMHNAKKHIQLTRTRKTVADRAPSQIKK